MAAGQADKITIKGSGLASVRSGRPVFSGLDFSLCSGQALVLRGPNGSGKSTLLRLVAGLLVPAAGDIHWSGAGAGDEPEDYRAEIHYLGHQTGLKTALTVRENIAFWAGLYGASESAADDAGQACERLGLGPITDLPVKYLSQGQQRRTALARLVAVKLPLWLLDEPNVGLDDFSNKVLMDLMAEHLRGGGMIMAATHTELGIADADVLQLGRGAAQNSVPNSATNTGSQ